MNSDDHDMYKRMYEQERQWRHHAERRIAALKGQITKLKKQKLP